MRRALSALVIAILCISPAVADEAARARLAGRTLDVVAGFDNAASGARLWGILAPALRQLLPETLIRTRFNDAGGGVSAINDMFALPEGNLSITLALMTAAVFAQTSKAEGVAYDLNKAQWIVGLQRDGQLMAAKRDLPLDMDTLRKGDIRLLSAVDVITGNSALITLILNAVTGLHVQLVVGFKTTDALRALVVGDVDVRRQMTTSEVNALLEAGEIKSLYVIGGGGFSRSVDMSRTLEAVALPGTPQSVIDYVRANAALGRAFLAGPTMAPEDVAALRTVFTELLSDPKVLADVEAQFAGITLVPSDAVEEMMKTLLLVDPAVRAAVDYAHDCGLEMSRNPQASCDFSTVAK